MPDMSDIKVGDEVVIDRGKYGVETVPVTKVARKYFTVETVSSYKAAEFEIATGRERVRDSNFPQYYTDRAYTPLQWEVKAARDALLGQLKRHDHKGYGDVLRVSLREMTEGELTELLHLLNRVRERAEVEDLDAADLPTNRKANKP